MAQGLNHGPRNVDVRDRPIGVHAIQILAGQPFDRVAANATDPHHLACLGSPRTLVNRQGTYCWARGITPYRGSWRAAANWSAPRILIMMHRELVGHLDAGRRGRT